MKKQAYLMVVAAAGVLTLAGASHAQAKQMASRASHGEVGAQVTSEARAALPPQFVLQAARDVLDMPAYGSSGAEELVASGDAGDRLFDAVR